jgi:cyclopropane-fatty-acyl-phospholipid synthase
MGIAQFVSTVFNDELPFRVEAYDGSAAGPIDAALTIKIHNPDAISRILTRPGELGLARAYVSGDISLEGDIDGLFALSVPPLRAVLRPALVEELLRETGVSVLRPLPAPPIEAHPRGLLHSRTRDRQAISHHYDISNEFYELVLGSSMTYSCAVFASPDDTLEDAQVRKVDLVARKLDLAPGMRLLDVGCGWGSMAIHAARVYGASVVGVTLSEPQQRYATRRAQSEGVGDLVQFRVQDFRDVADGPFDAISSIGMFEHVGRRSMEDYIAALYRLLRPGGRLLNHAIGKPATLRPDPSPSRVREVSRALAVAAGMRGPSRIRSPFMERYVFPDGELHEVGSVVSMFQAYGFEARHLESLREHYALTLRRWVENLDSNWLQAVEQVGVERARVWRLYMAGSAVGFERHHLEVHQGLFVRPDHGRSNLPLRPTFDAVIDIQQLTASRQDRRPTADA